ncbi:MAG: hypothetical protein R2739_05620 [Chitinophagales bacterium]|nr:hypothetical protein [Bacteroidota bacterium]
MENQLLDNDMLDNNESKSLNEILTNGYETHAVEYIKKGFEIFKQNIGNFIGYLIIVGVVYFIISSIPFIRSIGYALAAPLLAGGYIVAKKLDKNEPHTFSNFFDGLQKYVPLFLVNLFPLLLIALIYLIVGGWAYFKIAFLGIKPEINLNDLESLSSAFSAAGLGMRGSLAGIIAGIISILVSLGTLLVWFENFEPMKALDISRKIISKKFINWLGFFFLLGIFNVAGAICFGIGLLVTVPSSICAIYVAYEDVVGLNLRD